MNKAQERIDVVAQMIRDAAWEGPSRLRDKLVARKLAEGIIDAMSLDTDTHKNTREE